MRTLGTFFTGGGLFDIGARAAGYETIWGIEKDEKIARVARLNGFPVITANVIDYDLSTLRRPGHFHASPPCPNFSNAKTGAEETELDITMADAVCRALVHFKSDTFTLENVPNYRSSKSFQMIAKTLSDLGYWWDAENLNSADFGVPQTRVRLWVRASRGLLIGYPPPVKWKGWYQAIEDLLPSLPDSEFAPWQMERLPEEYKTFVIGNGTYSAPLDAEEPVQTITDNVNQRHLRAFVARGGNSNSNGYAVRESEEPMTTVTATMDKMPSRAFIVPGGNSNSFSVRDEDEPARTVESANRTGNNPRAFIVGDQSGQIADSESRPFTVRAGNSGGASPRVFVLDGQSNEGERITMRQGDEPIFTQSASAGRRPARAYSNGRVVKLDIRCLGRFQTVPDDYKGLTVKINGNGVPCLLAQRIMETFP